MTTLFVYSDWCDATKDHYGERVIWTEASPANYLEWGWEALEGERLFLMESLLAGINKN